MSELAAGITLLERPEGQLLSTQRAMDILYGDVPTGVTEVDGVRQFVDGMACHYTPTTRTPIWRTPDGTFVNDDEHDFLADRATDYGSRAYWTLDDTDQAFHQAIASAETSSDIPEEYPLLRRQAETPEHLASLQGYSQARLALHEDVTLQTAIEAQTALYAMLDQAPGQPAVKVADKDQAVIATMLNRAPTVAALWDQQPRLPAGGTETFPGKPRFVVFNAEPKPKVSDSQAMPKTEVLPVLPQRPIGVMKRVGRFLTGLLTPAHR